MTGIRSVLRRALVMAGVRVQPRLAIAAIFKDEGPYILEWLAYHRCFGVSQFFIADNTSSDGSTQLLTALARAGIIQLELFPGSPGVPPQLPAYDLIMERYGAQADWVAFIDGDEFLRPTTLGQRSIADWLGGLPASTGAVAVNWANYGSSGRVMPGRGLIHERFTRRAPDGDIAHSTYKSIVRTRDWRGTTGHPHRFMIPQNKQFVDTALRPVRTRKNQPGKAMRICWEALRIDHFVVKSKSEFIHKKRQRGRAGKAGGQHDLGFFDAHDRNEVVDPCPPGLLADIKAEMARLRALLPDLSSAVRDLDQQLDQLPPPEASENS